MPSGGSLDSSEKYARPDASLPGHHLREYLSSSPLSGDGHPSGASAALRVDIQRHALKRSGLRLKFENKLRKQARQRGPRGWTSRSRLFSLLGRQRGREEEEDGDKGGGGEGSPTTSVEPLALDKKLSDRERQRFKGVFLIAQFQKHHLKNLNSVRKAQAAAFAPLIEEGDGAGLFLVNECVAVKYSDYPDDFPGYDPATQSCRCPDGWIACDAAEAAAQRHQAWEPVLDMPGSGCTASGGQVMLKDMHFLSCAQNKTLIKYTGPDDVNIRDQQCKRAQFVLCRSVRPACVTGPW